MIGCFVASAAAWIRRDGPTNIDFEDGADGQAPPGWFCPTPGYKIEGAGDAVRGGKLCAKLSGAGQSFGNLMQSFDASAYQNKRVRLTAWVRVEPKDADRAQMWLRVDRTGDRMGLFDNMGDRPIHSKEWKQYEIIGNVDADARRINVGFMLLSAGAVFVDDVNFEVIGDSTKAAVEPARPLSDRGLENLVAFTKLYGYVRHFHPSDEAAEADWEKFAVDGVRAVEGAANAEQLAAKLNEIFAPLAPTVQVFAGAADQGPALPPEIQNPPGTESQFTRVYKHTGFGGGSMPAGQNIYGTKRPKREFAKGEQPDADRDPARNIWRADLGGGVSCMVPLTVYGDERGTLPAGAARNGKNGGKDADATKGARYSAEDRAARLAATVIFWNVMQHFYPYFDVVASDWNAALRDSLRRAASDADECAFLDTMKLLGAALHDGHVWVNHSCETKIAVPAFGARWIEDRLVITHLAGQGPKNMVEGKGNGGADASAAAGAELAKLGVTAGDAIVAIDGVPIDQAIAKAEALISGATPQWRRWRSQRNVCGGADGSSVTLEIENMEGARRVITVRREAGVLNEYAREPRPDPIAELKPGIMYVDIDRAADAEFAKAQPQFVSAKGIIVDFRGYPRGGNNVASTLLSHLTAQPMKSPQWHIPTPRKPDREEMAFAQSGWNVPPIPPRYTAKVAFLTDGRAISAAETFMGIVSHYRLGEIVGGPTAGTNGNVNPIALPGGFSVSWTGMKVLTQDGKQHHGIGIQPTIPAAPTRKGVAAGKDEVLELAIETVSKD